MQRRSLKRNTFDGGDDHLVILVKMLTWQRPNIDTTAVFGEKCRRFAGDVLAINAPKR